VIGAGVRAADPPADKAAFDRQVFETLRDVHNTGAALYNQGDPVGCYRLFQGALLTLKPLLAHRPDVQKQITDGLAAIDAEPSMSRRAFKLHELIEAVRKRIEPAGAAPTGPSIPSGPRETRPDILPKPPEAKPMPPAPMPTPPRPGEPRSGDTGPPLIRPASGTVSGVVTLNGQPLAEATVQLVAPNLQVFTTKTDAVGAFPATAVPPGRYRVVITGKPGGPAVPDRYGAGSQLTLEVAGGKPTTVNFELTSR
jgi:hypothetical protein